MGVLKALDGKAGQAQDQFVSKAVDLYDRCVGSERACIKCVLCHYWFSSIYCLSLGTL